MSQQYEKFLFWQSRKFLLTRATMVHGGTDQGEPEGGERLAKRKQITQAMAAKRMVAAMGCPLQLCPQDAHPPVLSEQSEKHSQSSLRVRLPRTTRCAPRASYGKYWLPSRVKTSFSCSEDVALRDKPGVTKNYSALSVTANSRPRGRSLLRTESYTPGSVPPITTMKGPSRWSGHKPMK